MNLTTHVETDPELTRLLNQIVHEVKKNQLFLTEVSALFKKLIQDEEKVNHPELAPLLSQVIDITKKNSLYFAELSKVYARLIKTNHSHSGQKPPLTAAEISALWLQFMGDSMSICVYKYFLTIVENEEIKSILQLSLQLAESHIAKITVFFQEAEFQVPVGFTAQDVNLGAPRLFTDEFLLFYSLIMTTHGLTAYGLAVTNCERQDIQNYFLDCIVTTKELFQKVTVAAESRPKFSGVPTVPSPRGVEYLDKTGVIANLLGEARPLNVSEISNLFYNSKKTGFVRSLSLAFSQVAESEEVRKFLLKNVKLAGQDTDSFDKLLQQDNLPIPRRWDVDITDATVSPFSDKLILFHAAFLVNAALSYYGAAIGSSLRSDLIANYNQVCAHAMLAGTECYRIMVKHGWLEKQPEAIDRNLLAHGAKK